METLEQMFPWLNFIDRPAFCVKNARVVAVNAAAEHRMLAPGTDIGEIVTQHRGEYEQLQNGCLYLPINVGGLICNAEVTRTRECDIFILYQDNDDQLLQALALAAQQLRIPLSNVMAVSDRFFKTFDEEASDAKKQIGQINHGLFQLLRIINNMSDSVSYQNTRNLPVQTVNLTGLADEIIEKVQALSEETGTKIAYSSPASPILTAANEERLSRAFYNLLSNALKFSPDGSTVEAKLTTNGNMISFSVCNPNIADAEDPSFWNQYRREPAIEDSRFGLGLGMTLVSAVATAHGGTVLIDHPEPGFTRVTMTLALTKETSGAVRSPILTISDYTGGRDKGLLEFAEILSADAYKNIN